MLKRITISGFRGILAKLDVSFQRGTKIESLIIYGRNGTGKSSITDAWEWLRNQKIEHLAREGAKETAYHHKAAKKGDSFVEVEFSNTALGVIRADFDHDRVTKPTLTGNHSALAALTPHPCHVRFSDLTRFVFLTKAERYDALALLMGFVPQVDFQKALRRVQKSLESDRNEARTTLDTSIRELRQLLSIADLDEKNVLATLEPLLKRHGVDIPTGLADMGSVVEALKNLVTHDPAAQRLFALRQFVDDIVSMAAPERFAVGVEEYSVAAIPYKEREDQLKKLLVIGLYERGVEVLAGAAIPDRCPLCGQTYEGDLKGHIELELEELHSVRTEHARVKALHATARQLISKAWPKDTLIDAAIAVCGSAPATEAITTYRLRLSDTRLASEAAIELLAHEVEDMTSKEIAALTEAATNLRVMLTTLVTAREEVFKLVTELIAVLQGDAGRNVLVADYELAARSAECWTKVQVSSEATAGIDSTYATFEHLINDYVKQSLESVQQRFDLISADVSKYFGILEKNTAGIAEPVLRILVDQDRAVVPEVVFHGEAVYPAYKYLSESQLNSFGLAVFLASARHFNKEFPFIILDDVVNSLDGYKRPQLIEILKHHFADYQILLLTHDSSWRDRIARACPSWGKLHFARHEYGIGPIVFVGYGTLETVKNSIERDDARQAGQALGPYLESVLQEIAENFQADIKYNRRNEYTLEPLIEAVRARAEKKLGKTHPLTLLVAKLKEESGFRNLTAHAKNPEIELTRDEIQIVVDLWVEIDKLTRCQLGSCERVLEFADPGFKCGCGNATLQRIATS